MCSPVAMGIASFALGAAQSVAQFAGNMRQYRQQQQLYEDNKVAAREAAVDRYASIGTRMLQERKAAQLQKFDVAVQAARARGTARAQAAAGGVTGLSVDALVNDYYTQQGRANSRIDQNTKTTTDYLRGELDATRHQAIARVHGVAIPSRPSLASAIIGVGSAALNGFSVYNDFQIA